ncbi:hypothetical protein WA158_005608 [Blastocystis sp. Blastoise]
MSAKQINVTAYINDGKKENPKTINLDLSKPWKEILQTIASSFSTTAVVKTAIYNEFGGEYTDASTLSEGDVLFFDVNGNPFISISSAASVPIKDSLLSNQPISQAQARLQSTPIPKDTPSTFSLRFIIVGNASVGKSCLLLQFTDKRFKESVGPTIGVDFGSSLIRVDQDVIKLQIWDTAGQEDFQAITRAYYREAAAAILVYDVADKASFDKLQSWLSSVQEYSTNPNIVITLVANKIDVDASKRVVTTQQGQEFATANNLLFFETSAKTGVNVDDVFIKTAYEVINRVKTGNLEISDRNGIKQTVNPQPTVVVANPEEVKKQKKCC